MEDLRRMNERLSVGSKVGLLLLLLLVVAAANVGIVFYYQSQVDTLGNSIDVAGQQRTLGQRMAFLSFMLAQGHDDEDLMQRAIDRYNENLEALDEGGTVAEKRLDAAPGETRDSLQQQRGVWTEYEQHAQTLVSTEPYNPEFQQALDYVGENDQELLERSDAVVAAYTEADDSGRYADEIDVAGRQRMLSQRMSKTAYRLSRLTSKPGSEAAEKLEARDEQKMTQLKSQLKSDAEEFSSALDALRDGGEHQGRTLDSPPPEATDELRAVEETWSSFGPRTRTVATTHRLNPEFWESLSYVERNTDQLVEASDQTAQQFATVSTERMSAMQSLLVLLLLFDVVVFVVGTMIGRRYIGKPIEKIADTAEAIADGDLDAGDSSDRVRRALAEEEIGDEITRLLLAFQRLQDYLGTAARQADALADKEFDADVLDDELPGTFGEALTTMQHDIVELIDDIEQMNDRLRERAEEFGAAMERAADGDLTTRLAADGDLESMREIARGFNQMMDELEDVLGEVAAFSDAVATSSQQMLASTEEVENASQEVSQSIQEISDGASVQSEKMQEVSQEMSTLSAAVEEVTSSASSVASTAEAAAEKGEQGGEAAEAGIEEIRAIRDETEETVAAVEQLDAQMDRIRDIISLISDIAEQTNMLALNANIEAARADEGSSAEGFSVVADEVKSLADETKQSAAEVEEIIEDVGESTERAVETMHATRERVDAGMETVEEALGALDEVSTSVEEVNSGMQEISSATDEQAQSAQQVVEMAEDVSAISQQTTSEAESVAAASEEQTASLTEVTRTAHALSERADELAEAVDRFTVDVEVGDVDVATAEAPEARIGGAAGSDGGAGDGEAAGAAGNGSADGSTDGAAEGGPATDGGTDGGDR